MTPPLAVQVTGVRRLQFDDGTPVRAASGVARFGDGWLIAQDDAVDGAWWCRDAVTRVPLLPSVQGRTLFGPSDGTKHLKPDLEAACRVESGAGPAVLLLGSGSLPARMTAVLVPEDGGAPQPVAADLWGLYAQVARALELPVDRLNLEGACQTGAALRWFQRGNLPLDLPSCSVDVDLAALLAALAGALPPEQVPVSRVRRYALGDVDGVGLSVTDALALPDGRILLSAAAEDTPNAVNDGPVVASALVLIDGDGVVEATAELPQVDGRPPKVEGMALAGMAGGSLDLVAVVDEDDERAASCALELRVSLG